jgi:hypothetical protein
MESIKDRTTWTDEQTRLYRDGMADQLISMYENWPDDEEQFKMAFATFVDSAEAFDEYFV